MRNLSKETDSQIPLAAEPWLTTLVEAIKKEDQAVAEKEYQAVRRAELIARKGPVFWRKFTDVLEVLFRQMEELFGDHVTKGKTSFTRSPYGGGISINKSAYPFVSFSATPNYSETTAHFTYTVVNPEIPSNIGVPGRFLPSRFGVEGDQVVLSLDGTLFTTPEAAAKFIMEKLFTIATSSPVAVDEPVEATIPEPNPLAEYAWPRLPAKSAFPVFDDAPVADAETKPEDAEPAAPVAVEEIPDAPAVIESVATAVEPEPAALAAPVSLPIALLPPPLPFAIVRTPAQIASPRAPLSKFFASASRLLGVGPSASSKILMTALAAPLPPLTVQAPLPRVEEPVVLEPIAEATFPSEAITESIAATEPVSPEPAECEDLELAEVAESSDVVSTSESKPLPLLVASSASRAPRRRVRPQIVRTRFRYQDPRRHMPIQNVVMPVAVRPEVRPVQVRQAAAG